MLKNRRIGKVTVSTGLIDNSPEVVKLMFSKFIPIRAEMIWHMGWVEYIGISDLFEEIKEGDAVPEYIFQCTTIEGDGGSIISGVTKL